MLHILDNLYTEADARLPEIEKLLRFHPEGYIWAPSYRNRHWDGWIKLTRKKGDRLRFPTGLLEYVQRNIPNADKWTVLDSRTVPPQTVMWPYSVLGVTPDALQEDAIHKAIGAGRGVVQMPTGAGKTIVEAAIIARLRRPALVLVGKRDLLRQLHERLEKWLGGAIGIVGDSDFDPKIVTVATYQSIYRWLDRRSDEEDLSPAMNAFRVVVVDEGHHAPAKTFEAVLKALPNAYFRYAFSATPFKSGGKADLGTRLQVMSWTGPLLTKVTATETIESGRTVPADVTIIQYGPEAQEPALNYAAEYQTVVVEGERRNFAIAALARRLSWRSPTLVLVERIEHGETLADLLNCPFVCGSTSKLTRTRLLREFGSETSGCLVASKIADEGLDLPSIQYLILAGASKAPHIQIQRIGRGTRKAEGKDRLFVFDFTDPGKYLSSHSRKRRRTYEKEPSYTVMDTTIEELLSWLK